MSQNYRVVRMGQNAVPSGNPTASAGFNPQNKVMRENDREVFHQPLYDRKNLATSLTGQISFFTVPLGSPDTLIRGTAAAASYNKTKRDTNLSSNGQDPSKDYTVFGIATALVPNARTVLATAATNNIRADIDNIREGGWLNFKIIDKNILDLPLLLIPECNAAGAISTTVNNGTIYGGPIALSAMWSFGEPIMIPKSTNFSIVLSWDGTLTLTQSFDMYIFMFAKVRRPV